MSEVIVPFLYELRQRKLRVGAHEAVSLAEALLKNLHDSSLDGFYAVARALCVHRESDLDAFDQAFAAHFRGVRTESLALTRELLDWLTDPKNKLSLTDEERAAFQHLDLEALRRLFEERLREQRERHDGGNRWIGTGGSSPFGSGGQHPTGMRVGPMGGGRSALAVADARQFRGYRDDVVLDVRHVEVALRKLRQWTREGQRTELDVEGTIDKTAQNGGELEVVVRPPRRSRVRVLLLMDVGGSMDPHAEAVSKLFSAAKRASNLKSLESYYFHNCIYGHVFETDRFTDPVPVSRLFERLGNEWKLVLVGDAAMHPGELLGSGDWAYYAAGGANASDPQMDRSGIAWMRRIADHFPVRAWLNPDPPHHWLGGTCEALGQVFPMFPLTLAGLGDAVKHLSRTNV